MLEWVFLYFPCPAGLYLGSMYGEKVLAVLHATKVEVSPERLQ